MCQEYNKYRDVSKLFFEEHEIQDFADHDKQVRKQVCDEIREIIIQKDSKLEKSTYSDSFVSGYHCCYCDVEQILDQIEKGE